MFNRFIRTPEGSWSATGTALLLAGVILAVSLMVLTAAFMIGGRVSITGIVAGTALMTLILAPALYSLVVAPVALLHTGRAPAVSSAGHAVPSTVDGLTRLPNKRGITASLLEAMAQAERYGDPLSVSMVRIGRFKELKGAHGAKGAERALQGMATVFAETLRMPDKAGRWEGEQFIVVLPHTKLKDAKMIADRLQRAAAAHDAGTDDKPLRFEVETNTAQFQKGEDLERMLSRLGVGTAQRPASRKRAVASAARSPAK